MTTIKFGELFAGIGGIGLGLENTGEFEVAWQVEKDPYALRVLEKHWPDVPRHDDVCTFPKAEGNWDVDLITGGFPCQDISLAGKGAGLEGARSGLFYEGIRIINRLRPRWVLLENVAALLIRGLDDVLRELAQIGYNAEWHCVPAAAIGAPHRRDRIFIIGHMADTVRDGLQGHRETGKAGQASIQKAFILYRSLPRPQWPIGAGVCRTANGIPSRIHRIRCLGNAVVPQVAQFIGEVILQRDREIFGKDKL